MLPSFRTFLDGFDPFFWLIQTIAWMMLTGSYLVSVSMG